MIFRNFVENTDMERISLSKTEKQVLRLASTNKGRPSTYPAHEYNAAARSLARKGLVKTKFYTTGDVCTIRLTDEGRQYMCENPSLANPVPWKTVSAITAILALIVSIIALFVSCMN